MQVVGSNERPQQDCPGMNPNDQMEVMVVATTFDCWFFLPHRHHQQQQPYSTAIHNNR